MSNDIEKGEPTDLKSKNTGGVIGTPQFNTEGTNFGSAEGADIKNSDAAQINISASEQNLSKQFKNPAVKQDVEPKGEGQYEN